MNTIFSALFFFSPARALPLTAQRDFHPPRDVTPPGRTDGRDRPSRRALEREVHVFVSSSSTAQRGAALQRDTVEGGEVWWCARRTRTMTVMEEGRGQGARSGRRALRTQPSLRPHFSTSCEFPRHRRRRLRRHCRRNVINVIVSSPSFDPLANFPFLPCERRLLARLKDRAFFLSLSLASGDGSRLRISLPSAPRVDNSLPRARPAEFCLSSPSPPSSLFLSLSIWSCRATETDH